MWSWDVYKLNFNVFESNGLQEDRLNNEKFVKTQINYTLDRKNSLYL